MNINFNKYKPIILKIEINKMEKICDYKYFISKQEFEKILDEILKKDISIDKLKYFLFNLKYLKNKEISTWIYKIKIRRPNKKIEGLEYCYYWVYLKYYKSDNMENIYNSITKLGKNTFQYMSLPKERDNFIASFQKLFHQGNNMSFLNFLYDEFKKRLSLNNFTFFEEYIIDYNNTLGKDLIKRYIRETLKEGIKDNKIKNNLLLLEERIKDNILRNTSS